MIESLLRLGADHPLEILVVDDDSRDGTPDLVRALARQDPRVRIIQRVDAPDWPAPSRKA